MQFLLEYLVKPSPEDTLTALFDILYANMRDIANMKRGYEAEKAAYLAALVPALAQPARQIILIRDAEALVGFFQYYVNRSRFMMEEIQFLPRVQGAGAFQALFAFLVARLPAQTPWVEAYAHKNNSRSRQILLHMGLMPIADETGDFWHFRGEYRALREKYAPKSGASSAAEVRNMKILIMNGPNLNLLGKREPTIYGHNTYDDLLSFIRAYAATRGVEVSFFQSNHEGALVDAIQGAMGAIDGIVINPGAYTHTSVALLDAVKAVGIPTVEVHISDPDTREEFRRVSYIRLACIGTVKGRGFQGYLDAIDMLIAHFFK